jgi:Leucine-rich repeat (LRR) protein
MADTILRNTQFTTTRQLALDPEMLLPIDLEKYRSVDLTEPLHMRTPGLNYTVTLEQLQDLEDIAALLTNVTRFTIDKIEYPEITQRILLLLHNLQICRTRCNIPIELRGCANLHTISITRNRTFTSLATLQVTAANITNLQLYSTGLSGTLDLTAFVNLKELDITNTSVSNVIGVPAGLVNAYMSGTRIRTVDFLLPAKESIVEVFVDECRNLVDIRALCECHNLVTLFAQSCAISIIPDEICQLQQLTELQLSDNPIDRFPDSLMTIETLEDISIEGCPGVMTLSPELSRFIESVIQDELEGEFGGDEQGEQFRSLFDNSENVHDTFIQAQVTRAMEAVIEHTLVHDQEALAAGLYTAIPSAKRLVDRFKLEVHWKTNHTIGQLMARVWQLATLLDPESLATIRGIIEAEIEEICCEEICFTGACGRMITAIGGFYDFANIQISETQYLNNLNVMITGQLGEEYTEDAHRDLLRQRMTELGYPVEEIEKWVAFIED